MAVLGAAAGYSSELWPASSSRNALTDQSGAFSGTRAGGEWGGGTAWPMIAPVSTFQLSAAAFSLLRVVGTAADCAGGDIFSAALNLFHVFARQRGRGGGHPPRPDVAAAVIEAVSCGVKLLDGWLQLISVGESSPPPPFASVDVSFFAADVFSILSDPTCPLSLQCGVVSFLRALVLSADRGSIGLDACGMTGEVAERVVRAAVAVFVSLDPFSEGAQITHSSADELHQWLMSHAQQIQSSSAMEAALGLYPEAAVGDVVDVFSVRAVMHESACSSLCSLFRCEPLYVVVEDHLALLLDSLTSASAVCIELCQQSRVKEPVDLFRHAAKISLSAVQSYSRVVGFLAQPRSAHTLTNLVAARVPGVLFHAWAAAAAVACTPSLTDALVVVVNVAELLAAATSMYATSDGFTALLAGQSRRGSLLEVLLREDGLAFDALLSHSGAAVSAPIPLSHHHDKDSIVAGVLSPAELGDRADAITAHLSRLHNAIADSLLAITRSSVTARLALIEKGWPALMFRPLSRRLATPAGAKSAQLVGPALAAVNTTMRVLVSLVTPGDDRSLAALARTSLLFEVLALLLQFHQPESQALSEVRISAATLLSRLASVRGNEDAFLLRPALLRAIVDALADDVIGVRAACAGCVWALCSLTVRARTAVLRGGGAERLACAWESNQKMLAVLQSGAGAPLAPSEVEAGVLLDAACVQLSKVLSRGAHM